MYLPHVESRIKPLLSTADSPVTVTITDPLLTNQVAIRFRDFLANPANITLQRALAEATALANNNTPANDRVTAWNVGALAAALGFVQLHGFFLIVFGVGLHMNAAIATFAFPAGSMLTASQGSITLTVERHGGVTGYLPQINRLRCSNCDNPAMGTCADCNAVYVCSSACLENVHSSCFGMNLLPVPGQNLPGQPVVSANGNQYADPRSFINTVLLPAISAAFNALQQQPPQQRYAMIFESPVFLSTALVNHAFFVPIVALFAHGPIANTAAAGPCRAVWKVIYDEAAAQRFALAQTLAPYLIVEGRLPHSDHVASLVKTVFVACADEMMTRFIGNLELIPGNNPNMQNIASALVDILKIAIDRLNRRVFIDWVRAMRGLDTTLEDLVKQNTTLLTHALAAPMRVPNGFRWNAVAALMSWFLRPNLRTITDSEYELFYKTLELAVDIDRETRIRFGRAVDTLKDDPTDAAAFDVIARLI